MHNFCEMQAANDADQGYKYFLVKFPLFTRDVSYCPYWRDNV